MEPKRLYRIPSEGMIGGVCTGLGEHLSVDPWIIRVIFILLSFGGFIGLGIYLIMLGLVPVKPEGL